MENVTQILMQFKEGDCRAAEKLLPLVYEELRTLAHRQLQKEKPGQTLQATALVHEAYLRLVDTEKAKDWDCRAHFFVAAAEAMRRVLVENARRKRQIKRGGDLKRQSIEVNLIIAPETHEDLVALDEALDRLQAVDAQAVELVHLRYFVGLSIPKAAKILGISPRTADRLWAFARVWLRRELGELEKTPCIK